MARAVPAVFAERIPSRTLVAVSPAGRPAQVLVLADDDLVEGRRGERAVFALVLVAPVARDPDDADRARPVRVAVAAAPSRPDLVGASTIIRSTKSASWRIPSTLWQ